MFVDDKEIYNVLGFLNTKLIQRFVEYLNPTTNKCVTDMLNIPYIQTGNVLIKKIVEENVKKAQEDWDSFETSWDFKKHPLI